MNINGDSLPFRAPHAKEFSSFEHVPIFKIKNKSKRENLYEKVEKFFLSLSLFSLFLFFSLSSLFLFVNLCVFWPESSSYHSQNANGILNSTSMLEGNHELLFIHRLKVKSSRENWSEKSWVFMLMCDVDDEVHDTNLCNGFRLKLIAIQRQCELWTWLLWRALNDSQDTLWHNSVSLLSCFSTCCFPWKVKSLIILYCTWFAVHSLLMASWQAFPLVKRATL